MEQALEELAGKEQVKAIQARKRDAARQRLDACLEVALARLDSKLLLSPKQHARLLGLLREVAEKYGPDIDEQFRGWGDRQPWFLQSYYLLIPCSGVAEQDLKEVLSEWQLAKWNELATAHGGHYWGQILEYHEQRMQMEKQGAKRWRPVFEP